MSGYANSAHVDDESKLVLLLSNPYPTPEEVEQIETFCGAPLDWNRVLGMLLLHRTAGQAWVNLATAWQSKFRARSALLGLRTIFNGQRLYVREQIDRNVEIINHLESAGIRCALMKGAAIARMGYTELGVRTFSDNDFLFDSSDLARVGVILRDLGYIQGFWDQQARTVRAAPRSEVILHPLTSHETFPFVKHTPEASILECHCVDVHFSVDLMTSNRNDQAVRELLDRRLSVTGNADGNLWALSREDMFVFLCVHYQREASNQRDAGELRDLLLYKVMDLLALLGDQSQPIDLDLMAERATILGFRREVFYALTHLEELYPARVPEGLVESFRPSGQVDFLNQVMHKGELVHTWNSSVTSRFFNPQRILELTC